MNSPIEKLLDQEVEWEKIDPKGFVGEEGTLYATHQGVLEIGAAKLRVYQLNDGQRVFDADDVATQQKSGKPEPHIPPPTFEDVPEDRSKLKVTKLTATGEIIVRNQVPVKEFRGDARAPERPKRLQPEPQEPVGTVGWVCAKWIDYRLALHQRKAAIRAGALPPEEFDKAEEEYWAYFAHTLTREERRDLARGRVVAIVRPVEPEWKKGEVLHLTKKLSARVDSITRTLKGWRTEVVIEDFRSFFMKGTVGGSSVPTTDDEGFAAEPTSDEIERARLDGAYTQTEEQAVPEGGEVLEDRLHRRLHQEAAMKRAMAMSAGKVRTDRLYLEHRLNDARKKHQRSTVKVLERKVKAAKRHEEEKCG